MQYTSYCRARVIAEISQYLYDKMQKGNPVQKIEAEYDLADSEWFRNLCNAVKVTEYDNIIKSLHQIIDNLSVWEKSTEYSYASRQVFTNRKHLIEEIIKIINNCTNKQ